MPSRPTVSDETEGAILARILPLLSPSSSATLGPGDDAAVVSAPDGRFVVTTDLMVHGPDFRLAWSSPWELGWKAAATNLSDVAAMGARPTALVIALAVTSDMPVVSLEEFARGVSAAIEQLSPDCGVVGGDLSVSDTFTIAVTAFGDLEGRAPVVRSGAKVGDVVAVSGALGNAADGLSLLFRDAVDEDGRPDAARAARLRETEAERLAAQLTPSPPIADGVLAAVAGATAMLDLSDGLAKDAARVAAASGVGIDFDSATLGPDVARALGGGEDHSLFATFPPGTALPGGFRRVGTVVASPVAAVTCDAQPVDVAGWDPYAGWDGGRG
ncbi:thiamine-phosphate kinase [Labedella gwakjiensis]|uniref:Thiamine-monophosphate kinase n=1 Tax=Labedella gwakjiensis TaxID=390269 RepID=A0A2P8H0Q3_9MICO|nr:thiamine-phosphate kinase [Labedella gwakjiensis]PSL39803.1 thiamine-phosphate kinase [Labedella gwakjiensis]RUQ85818.1 thiamine-phosphate kinase [Labedella gwakjiensis]